MSAGTIFLSHDNVVTLQLQTALIPYDLSAVTKITAVFGDTDINSSDPVAGTIRWNQSGFETGEIRLVLGDESIDPRLYPEVSIVTYEPITPDGFVWGKIPIVVEKEVLNTP